MSEENFKPLACPKCGKAQTTRIKWKAHAQKCGISLPFDVDMLKQAREAYETLYGTAETEKPKTEKKLETSKLELNKNVPRRERTQKMETEKDQEEEEIDKEVEEEEETEEWQCGTCNAEWKSKKRPKKCPNPKCGVEFRDG